MSYPTPPRTSLNEPPSAQELLSLLADDQCDREHTPHLHTLWRTLGSGTHTATALREDWSTYHLIGDALRSSTPTAHTPAQDLLAALHTRMEQEKHLDTHTSPVQLHTASVAATGDGHVQTQADDAIDTAALIHLTQRHAQRSSSAEQRHSRHFTPRRAANDEAPGGRWKMAAGFCAVATLVLLASRLSDGTDGASADAAQLAASPPPVATQPEPQLVAVPTATDQGTALVLRDPRLDALLAQHQQYAPRAPLQVPADFLRNAGFVGHSVHMPQSAPSSILTPPAQAPQR